MISAHRRSAAASAPRQHWTPKFRKVACKRCTQEHNQILQLICMQVQRRIHTRRSTSKSTSTNTCRQLFLVRDVICRAFTHHYSVGNLCRTVRFVQYCCGYTQKLAIGLCLTWRLSPSFYISVSSQRLNALPQQLFVDTV